MKKIFVLLVFVFVLFSQNFSSNAEFSKPYAEETISKSKGESDLINRLVKEGKISESEVSKVKILGYVEKELSDYESIQEKTAHNQDRDNKGVWIQTDGRWWFKYSDGHYSIGWDQIDGKWYYFDSEGWMKSSEWIQLDGKWYYLTNSGAMATGLFEVNGKNHFFRDNGSWAENDGVAISLYGQTFVGKISYVFGADKFEYGGKVDCSSFVKGLHKAFGYNLPRTSSEQYKGGTYVDYSNALPGDVICYEGHVAIYIGNEKVVHAANSEQDVMISNAKTKYNTFLGVRRYWK